MCYLSNGDVKIKIQENSLPLTTFHTGGLELHFLVVDLNSPRHF